MQMMLMPHELRDAVAGLSLVVPRRATLPALRLVQLRVRQGQAVLTATDLNSVLAYRCCPAQSPTEGAALVPLEELSRLAHGQGAEPVELTAEGDRLRLTKTVAGQPLSRQLITHPLAGWPALPPQPAVGAVDHAWLEHLRQAAPFASRDPAQPLLGGLYLDSQPAGDYLVATDGRRLSAFRTVSQPFRTGCIVPASPFLLWDKLAPTELQIGHTADQPGGWFRLVTPRWDYQVRTLAGTYPDWRQVLPQAAGAHVLTVSAADAALLAEALPTFAAHAAPQAGVSFHQQDGHVVVRGTGLSDQQAISLRLATSTLAPQHATLSVDRDYLREALAAGFRVFRFAGEQGPLYSRERRGGLHVLMPLRRSAAQPAPRGATQGGP
jgi:DNA polymerase III sliding clamp (beta) subunit (PCNA family)